MTGETAAAVIAVLVIFAIAFVNEVWSRMPTSQRCAVLSNHLSPAVVHCQVPCGIFNDPARVNEMMEDASTIKKAMNQINELHSKGDALSMNQTVRWIMVKEEHAAKIITTMSEYFLTQKVKDDVVEGDSQYPVSAD